MEEVQLSDIKKSNTGLKAAILTMSFIQMATNAVASILANIAAEFPETSVTTVQYPVCVGWYVWGWWFRWQTL